MATPHQLHLNYYTQSFHASRINTSNEEITLQNVIGCQIKVLRYTGGTLS